MIYTKNIIHFAGNDYTEGFPTNLYGKEYLTKDTYIEYLPSKTVICTQGFALYILNTNIKFYSEGNDLVLDPN